MTMTTLEPTDLELQLALGFENLCECLRDTVRGHGLNKSKWAERLHKDVKKYSEKWENLHRCVLDTDDIPGLLSIKDPKVYRTRQTCRIKDQKLAEKRSNEEYCRLLLEAARMSDTEFDASKSVDEFPRNLFYSEKPWVTTTVEHLPRMAEGDDLVFFKFFNEYLGEGRVPEHVWLQAKLHLFLIEDHMKQGQGEYCSLNPTLIATCLTPSGPQQNVIRIEEGDNLGMLIRDSAEYYIGALLPRLHECNCAGYMHAAVHDSQIAFPDFIPEQDQNKIEVGTTVYNVNNKRIGVVKEFVKAHGEAKVAWEGDQQAKLRRCQQSNLIVTPVKRRVEPKTVGERVVVMGATDLTYIGKQGTIRAYNLSFCEVLLDGPRAEVRKFSRKLLHSLTSSDLVTHGARETLCVPFEGNPMECQEEVNKYFLQEGQGFQIILKYVRNFDALADEDSHEGYEKEGSSSEEEGLRRVEEYCRLALLNSTVIKGYLNDRLEELNTNFSVWFCDWDIDAYIWWINTRLANTYKCMDLNSTKQYVWVCQTYVYRSIESATGDFMRMKNLWNRIPLNSEFLLLPVGTGFHWSLLLIAFPLDPQETFVLHLDSMSKGSYSADRIEIDNIRLFLLAGKYIECGDNVQYENLHVEVPQSPQQQNSYDCGPFTLACIRSFANAIECQSQPFGKSDVISLINKWEFGSQTAEKMRSKVHEVLCAVESGCSLDSIN